MTAIMESGAGAFEGGCPACKYMCCCASSLAPRRGQGHRSVLHHRSASSSSAASVCTHAFHCQTCPGRPGAHHDPGAYMTDPTHGAAEHLAAATAARDAALRSHAELALPPERAVALAAALLQQASARSAAYSQHVETLRAASLGQVWGHATQLTPVMLMLPERGGGGSSSYRAPHTPANISTARGALPITKLRTPPAPPANCAAPPPTGLVMTAPRSTTLRSTSLLHRSNTTPGTGSAWGSVASSASPGSPPSQTGRSKTAVASNSNKRQHAVVCNVLEELGRSNTGRGPTSASGIPNETMANFTTVGAPQAANPTQAAHSHCLPGWVPQLLPLRLQVQGQPTFFAAEAAGTAMGSNSVAASTSQEKTVITVPPYAPAAQLAVSAQPEVPQKKKAKLSVFHASRTGTPASVADQRLQGLPPPSASPATTLQPQARGNLLAAAASAHLPSSPVTAPKLRGSSSSSSSSSSTINSANNVSRHPLLPLIDTSASGLEEQARPGVTDDTLSEQIGTPQHFMHPQHDSMLTPLLRQKLQDHQLQEQLGSFAAFGARAMLSPLSVRTGAAEPVVCSPSTAPLSSSTASGMPSSLDTGRLLEAQHHAHASTTAAMASNSVSSTEHMLSSLWHSPTNLSSTNGASGVRLLGGRAATSAEARCAACATELGALIRDVSAQAAAQRVVVSSGGTLADNTSLYVDALLQRLHKVWRVLRGE